MSATGGCVLDVRRIIIGLLVLIAPSTIGCSSDGGTNDNGSPSSAAGSPSLPSSGNGGAAAGTGGMASAVGMSGGGGAAGTTGMAGMMGSGTAGASGMPPAAGSAGTAGAAGMAGAGGAGGEPPTDTHRPATGLMLPTMMESPNVAPWFNVYRPADLSATGAPLPIIAWANGGCVREETTWRSLLERWAAGGYFVMALTVSPDEPLLGFTAKEQHGELLDWVIEQAEQTEGPYAGKLDTQRIVIAGNSCGGVTALEVAAQDERVRSVFVLSGSSALAASDRAIMGAIKAPVGYVVGSAEEDIASPNANMDYDLLAAGIPAMVMSRSSGDHPTVSTDVNVLADVADIALNWMDLSLYGTSEAFDALTSPNVCSSCEPGVWMLKSKHLETLEQ